MTRYEFDLPDGVDLPRSGTDANRFEVLATLERKPSGKFCLVAVEGKEMPEKSRPHHEGGFLESMMRAHPDDEISYG